MQAIESADGLGFDDKPALDNEVDPVGTQWHSLVGKADGPLAFDGKMAPHELDRHGIDIDRLKQPWPELPVDLDRRPNGTVHHVLGCRVEWRRQAESHHASRGRSGLSTPFVFFVIFVASVVISIT